MHEIGDLVCHSQYGLAVIIGKETIGTINFYTIEFVESGKVHAGMTEKGITSLKRTLTNAMLQT